MVKRDRDVGVALRRSPDEMHKVEVAGESTGARGRLEDDGRAGRVGSLNDCLNLHHGIHVERREAVSALGGSVEQRTHRYESHQCS
jgi:hypothetical protein